MEDIRTEYKSAYSDGIKNTVIAFARFAGYRYKVVKRYDALRGH